MSLWQKAIQKNAVSLTEYLPDNVVMHMVQEDLLNHNDLERLSNIKKNQSRADRNEDVLMLLFRAVDSQIVKFVEILEKEGGDQGEKLAYDIKQAAVLLGAQNPAATPSTNLSFSSLKAAAVPEPSEEDTADEAALNQLSYKFASELSSIAIYLKIPHDRLQQIQRDNRGDSRYCNFVTLMEFWSRNKDASRESRMDTLKRALAKSGRADLAMELTYLFKSTS